MTIADIFVERCRVWSDIHEHLPTLYQTVVDNNAQVVVELGVRSGNSTAALLAAVVATGGHLYSVDIGFPNWPQDFYTCEQSTLIVGDDLVVSDRIPDEIDVLFIDTSHYYDQTLAELRLYGPRAYTILLHDTMLETPYEVPESDPPYPVRAAVDAWCDEVGRTWTNFENCYGLGVIHPKEA